MFSFRFIILTFFFQIVAIGNRQLRDHLEIGLALKGAGCTMRFEQFELAIDLANQVLDVDPSNAAAKMQLDQIAEAMRIRGSRNFIQFIFLTFKQKNHQNYGQSLNFRQKKYTFL